MNTGSSCKQKKMTKPIAFPLPVDENGKKGKQKKLKRVTKLTKA